jgi:MerR family transcriptional regulator, copper efflux regulator
MRSGELARLSAVSTDTLRHYERLGLLPRPPRTSGGYRDYPAGSLARVQLIRRAMHIGFSLPDVAAVLKLRERGEFPCHHARQIATQKVKQLTAQIRELTALRRQLQRILRDWDVRLARTAKGKPARLLENLPAFQPPMRLASQLQNTSRTGRRT